MRFIPIVLVVNQPLFSALLLPAVKKEGNDACFTIAYVVNEGGKVDSDPERVVWDAS